MNHREFKEAEARHLAAAHALIHGAHREAAATRLIRDTESLKERCEEAGEVETAAWLHSAAAAVKGARREMS